MGWTFTHKPESMPIKAFFEEKFNCDNEHGTWVVLDCAVVRLCTAYLAIRWLNKTIQQENVVGVVCHLAYRRSDYYNFGYKDVCETSGPCASEAPKRILELLSPTDEEWALQWRARCWEKIQKNQARPRLSKGKIIRHKTQALTFRDGAKRRYFEVIKRGCYRSLDDNRLCKLSRDVLHEMEVCSREVAEADLWSKPTVSLQNELF